MMGMPVSLTKTFAKVSEHAGSLAETTEKDPASAAVQLDRVTKIYGATTAIDDVSFAVHPGEVVVLLGRSGSGKTTIFRCITRLAMVESGDIQVFGRSIHHLSRGELLEMRRSLGLIFQQFNLIGRLSSINNVLAGRLGHVSTLAAALRRFSTADRQRALAALDRVGLLEKAYQRADSLSGGQQQRVAIARVLTQESRVILADEPVASLDPKAAHTVLRILREVAHERKLAVLCSLHQVDLARAYADRIIGMSHGRVQFDIPAKRFSDEAMISLYGRLTDDEEET